MSDWRKILVVADLKSEPLTEEMLKNNEINIGDYVSPTVTLEYARTGRVSFIKDKVYRVLQVTPTALTILSEDGPHIIYFGAEGSGGIYFQKTVLTPDEQLGVFESIPYDILGLLLQFQHSSTHRRAIVDELLLRYHTIDKLKKEKLKHDIEESIALLVNHGYMESGDRIGTYKISTKGRLFYQDKHPDINVD